MAQYLPKLNKEARRNLLDHFMEGGIEIIEEAIENCYTGTVGDLFVTIPAKHLTFLTACYTTDVFLTKVDSLTFKFKVEEDFVKKDIKEVKTGEWIDINELGDYNLDTCFYKDVLFRKEIHSTSEFSNDVTSYKLGYFLGSKDVVFIKGRGDIPVSTLIEEGICELMFIGI